MSSSQMVVDASSWSLLRYYLRPHRLQMIALWLLMLGMLAAQLVNPQIIGRFLDAAESGQPLNVLVGAAGLFILIAVIEQLMGLVGAYVGSDVGWLDELLERSEEMRALWDHNATA